MKTGRVQPDLLSLDTFERLYNTFKRSDMYTNMKNTVENSEWHQEKNVAVHTDMVVQNYIEMSPTWWDRDVFVGALACMFHDVGKPAAGKLEMNQPKDDSGRVRYAKHELISARMFEDYVLSNWDTFSSVLTPHDIYTVGWLIENHLPYRIEKTHKRQDLKRTVDSLVGLKTFRRVLLADQLGRISVNHDTKFENMVEWLADFNKITYSTDTFDSDSKVLYILIGASGSGKTTYASKMNLPSWGYDKYRMEWYDQGDGYMGAYKRAEEDSTFKSRAIAEAVNMLREGKSFVVDATNVSSGSRTNLSAMAKQKNYKVVNVLFLISLDKLKHRFSKRTDRGHSFKYAQDQYDNLKYPSLGQYCDEVNPILG